MSNQADKKPASYYGGYSLHRNGGVQNGAAAHQARQMAAAFNQDWFAANMMSMFGVAPPQAPLMMAPAQTPSATAAPQPEKNLNNISGSKFQLPFLGGLLPAAPNFYKGTPLRAPQMAQNSAASPPTPVATAAFKQASAAAAAPRKAHPVPHFSDAWNAFDAVATTQSQKAAHHDPIGTPAPRSVWAGTPVADSTVCTSAQTGSSSFSTNSGSLKPFSVWSSPVSALKDTVVAFSRPSAVASADEDLEHAKLVEKNKDKFSAMDVNSDDEDWVEHLQTTLKTVLSSSESADQQSMQSAGASSIRAPSPIKHVEMEWAQRAPHAAF